MNNLINFSHLHPSFIGFERLFDEINTIDKAVRQTSYPPYNIIKLEENKFVIEMAVAGFSESDIDITTEKNKLSIKGKKNVPANLEYIHKGISSKEFEQTFTLIPTIVIKDATFKDGMLNIYLENIIPDEMKPRKISISNKNEVKKQLLME